MIATRNPAVAKPIVEEFPQTGAAALDLADLRSVRAFCASWTGHVDAVVANAGIMMLPGRLLTEQGWELHLATNYLGHFALIHGLHDALRAADEPRVVTLSSSVHRLQSFDFDDPHFERRPYERLAAYAQSKTASVLLAIGISQRWAQDGISANACQPGRIATKLPQYLDRAPDHFKNAEQGAATTVLLAASPLLAGVSGRYFEDNQEAEVVEGGPDFEAGAARWSMDPETADRLWDYALPVIDKAMQRGRLTAPSQETAAPRSAMG
jgi:NAD(P)-dependent dehydrogenase (short-subunit alcohol dehydrogenase family)